MFGSKSAPSTIRFFLLLTALTVTLFTCLFLLHRRTSTARTITPSRTISPLLHEQNLSHFAFHNKFTKPYLLSLLSVSPSNTAVIIGLESGKEALLMGRTHAVHAFEPMPHFVERFRNRPKDDIRNVTVYPVAATATDGMIDVVYKGVTKHVKARRAERLLPDGIEPTVVSVDVQGQEYDALKGLGSVLDRTNSVWVEVSCAPQNTPPRPMLEFLDDRFVLFDFVPWGKRADVEDPKAREQFHDVRRPDGIAEWEKWFCGSRKEYLWLQTDVVGIRRDLLEKYPHIEEGLRALGERNCEEGCAFREALDL